MVRAALCCVTVAAICLGCSGDEESAGGSATTTSTQVAPLPADTTTVPPPTPPADCDERDDGAPGIALVGASGPPVAMDVVYYSDLRCGRFLDGEPMFDNGYRPSTAATARDSLAVDGLPEDVTVHVDVRALELGVAYQRVEPRTELAGDGRVVAVPAAGCSVVTVAWSSDASAGRFVGLVEATPGACDQSAFEPVTRS